MPLLDALIYGLRDVFDGLGNQLPRRSRIKFTGNVTDVPGEDLLLVESGGAGVSSVSGLPEIVMVATMFTTNQGAYDRAGARKIDMEPWPATSGDNNRVVKLVCDVQKTDGAASVEVRLFDVTNNAEVKSVSYGTNQALTEITSTAITVGTSNGNLRTDVAAMYEVSVRMNGGDPVDDAVYLNNARLVFAYEAP